MRGIFQSQGPQQAFTQSFALQLISLMLFILIFTIAAFLKDDVTAEAKPVALSETSIKPPLQNTLSREIFSTSLPLALSEAATLELGARLAPFSSIVRNHDVTLRITAYFSHGDSLETAVALSEAVAHVASQEGTPREAILTSLVFSATPQSPTVTLERIDESR